MQKNIQLPAISIIVPTYNAERYIAEFFESLLQQTFKDFELIIIDDCSTDSTVEIIEKYLPRFENVQFIKRQINSGSGSWIRNSFIKYSSGEYILHLDDDDILLPDALKNFWAAVEQFQPDMVCTEKYYMLDESKDNKLTLETIVKNLIEQPTFEQLQPHERINRFIHDEFIRFHWNKIVKRDFLIRNEIKFPDMPISQDYVYSFQCFMTADNIVRIPTVANVYRLHRDSGSQLKHKTGNDMLQRWTKDLIIGSDFMQNFMNRIDFFQNNPEWRYNVVDCFIRSYINNFMLNFYNQIPAYFAESDLREEFIKYPQNSITLSVHLIGLVNHLMKEVRELKESKELK